MKRTPRSGRAEVEALCDAVRETYPQGAEAVVAVVRTAFTTLLGEVAALRTDVAALRRQFDADSTTSSKPPSSDRSRLRRVRHRGSLRERTGRRPGGQRGHPGETLAWRAAPTVW